MFGRIWPAGLELDICGLDRFTPTDLQRLTSPRPATDLEDPIPTRPLQEVFIQPSSISHVTSYILTDVCAPRMQASWWSQDQREPETPAPSLLKNPQPPPGPGPRGVQRRSCCKLICVGRPFSRQLSNRRTGLIGGQVINGSDKCGCEPRFVLLLLLLCDCCRQQPRHLSFP